MDFMDMISELTVFREIVHLNWTTFIANSN